MSRPPAAKIFSGLYWARRIPEFSRITIGIAALSAENHTRFPNHAAAFRGVK